MCAGSRDALDEHSRLGLRVEQRRTARGSESRPTVARPLSYRSLLLFAFDPSSDLLRDLPRFICLRAPLFSANKYPRAHRRCSRPLLRDSPYRAGEQHVGLCVSSLLASRARPSREITFSFVGTLGTSLWSASEHSPRDHGSARGERTRGFRVFVIFIRHVLGNRQYSPKSLQTRWSSFLILLFNRPKRNLESPEKSPILARLSVLAFFFVIL